MDCSRWPSFPVIANHFKSGVTLTLLNEMVNRNKDGDETYSNQRLLPAFKSVMLQNCCKLLTSMFSIPFVIILLWICHNVERMSNSLMPINYLTVICLLQLLTINYLLSYVLLALNSLTLANLIYNIYNIVFSFILIILFVFFIFLPLL